MQQQQDTIYEPSDDATLFDRYGQIIFAYVRLHIALREDAEDVTLEVFTAALENDNLAALTEGEQLAWLRRVAHNNIQTRSRETARVSPTRSSLSILMWLGQGRPLPFSFPECGFGDAPPICERA